MRTSEEPLPNKNYKLEESHFGWLQIEIAAQQDTVCSNNHRYCIILGAVVLNTGGFLFQRFQTYLIALSLCGLTFNLNRWAM